MQVRPAGRALTEIDGAAGKLAVAGEIETPQTHQAASSSAPA
jgi:hypothetical protein